MASKKTLGSLRFVWIFPIILFGYATMLTQSPAIVGLMVASPSISGHPSAGGGRCADGAVLPIMFTCFQPADELGVAKIPQQRIQLWSQSLKISAIRALRHRLWKTR